MQKTNTLTVQVKFDKLEANAVALILYAQKDHTFREILKTEVANAPFFIESKQDLSGDVRGIEVIVPDDQETALRRLNWMFEAIKVNADNNDSQAAMERLMSWQKRYPKGDFWVLIIGIVGLAIPGVTLGVIKRRKKMAVVVREDLVKKHQNNVLEMAEKINQASMGLVSNAMKNAQGNLKAIDPDVMDWVSGEAQLRYFKASQSKIQSIKNELDRLDVLSGQSENEQENMIDVLAVSPAVSNNFQQIYWELDAIEK